MKIKKVLKDSTYRFLPFLTILLFLFAFFIFKKDTQYAHLAYSFWPGGTSLEQYYIKTNLKKFQNKLSLNKEKGFQQVHFFITEKNKKKLLKNVPISADKYIDVNLIDDEGIKEEVKFKYKGSNPLNWLFEQKEIRFKRKKKNIRDLQRRFDYRISQAKIINDFVYYQLAKSINKIGYDTKLVELFINNEPNGIYLKRNVLREGFLRWNKLMPVNIYKGEQKRYSDKNIGSTNNFFHNPSSWQKISYLNSMKENDFSDLELFLQNLIDAQSSKAKMKEILDYENLDNFSNYASFQIITQSITFDNFHNARLIIDPWSGQKHFVVHDGSYTEDFIIDGRTFDVTLYDKNQWARVLSESSKFLNKTYEKTFYNLNEKKVLDKVILELEKNKKKYQISFKRDFGHIQRKYLNFQNEESINTIDKIILSLKKRKKNINDILIKKPTVSWDENPNGFKLKIDKLTPVSNLKINFEDKIPNWVVLDINNNSQIDNEDIYFYPKNENFLLDLVLYANRIVTYRQVFNNYSGENVVEVTPQNTEFNFITQSNTKLSKIFGQNHFTKQTFEIPKKTNISYLPTLHNLPIYNKPEKTININGLNIINETKVFENEIIIEKGTIFELCENCSLIFKNKITALGTKKLPIIIRSQTKKSWGTFAIIGKKTHGSKLNNIIIENGSGATHDGINFFSSLSIHNSKNIIISNLHMKKNSIYDDMVHIIYSKNIKIHNSTFTDSLLDTIDVDISDNINFLNVNIINSGNDGIDLMESTSTIENTLISNSKDKGLSVGEGSKIELINSNILENNYGIASKDSSVANVNSSNILNNDIQLAVYKKNWRYNKSGTINLNKNVILNEDENIFQIDKNGKIIFNNHYQNIEFDKIKEFSLQ
tara:strand:- start:2621 stop:5260 length:2640 start_codon:yes stop_codon:yes gene_type:complete